MRLSRLIVALVVLVVLSVLAWVLLVRAPQPPNLLLITVETLRRDHCSLYGYERDTTPFLRELAKESIVFDNAWSMSSWTYPSMACVLSGYGPEKTGVWHAASEPQTPMVWWLPGLHQRGYRTAYHSTNRFVTRLAFGSPRYGAYSLERHRIAGELLRETAEWLTATKRRPWCVCWHLYDPHGPYDAPWQIAGTFRGDYRGRMGGDKLRVRHIRERTPISTEENRYIQARYDEEILYVDRTLERLVGLLRQMGQWQNTCLVLTADHGEAFGERGQWGHGHPPHEDQTAVPFLVRLPGGKHGGTHTNALVAGIDVLPTLLAQVGIPLPEDLPGIDAVSLLHDPHPNRVLHQHHIAVDWQDEEHVTYRLTHRSRGILCGIEHTVEELPLVPDEAAPQVGDPSIFADLRDLGYL